MLQWQTRTSLLKKNVMDNTTRTTIHKLNAEEIITELSRMLGGTEINGIVYDNAKEMKRQADELKKNVSVKHTM